MLIDVQTPFLGTPLLPPLKNVIAPCPPRFLSWSPLLLPMLLLFLLLLLMVLPVVLPVVLLVVLLMVLPWC